MTPEMVEKLKPGMTMRQVKFVMGSPQLADPFHNSRWDYLYTLRTEGQLIKKKYLVLYFDGDLLNRIVDETPDSLSQK